jgi:hypothetical protein
MSVTQPESCRQKPSCIGVPKRQKRPSARPQSRGLGSIFNVIVETPQIAELIAQK